MVSTVTTIIPLPLILLIITTANTYHHILYPHQAVRIASCDFKLDFADDGIHMRVLGEYIFPEANRSTVNYEELLEVRRRRRIHQ